MNDEPAPLWDDRYRVVRMLGAGGMGRVLLAEDLLQGGRAVAIKRLLPEHGDLAPAFLREFRYHRQLAHPHIPRAYELGFAEDQGALCPYYTMEVAPGVPLFEMTRRYAGGLPLRAVMQLVAGLLRALDHMHRAGLVHGDLKPANMLISERADGLHLVLIDFGVTLPIGDALGEDALVTPEYAAPELIAGGACDARTDLYAVGLVLYELLENRRPWPMSDVDLLWQQRTSAPVPPLTTTSCPPALAAIVHRLLAPAPDERPRSAQELLAELCHVTGWEEDIEPPEAFLQRLLTVPLPWRARLEQIAAQVARDPLPAGEPRAIIVDVPAGFFARRLLGPVLDEAGRRRVRIVPVRFDSGTGRLEHAPPPARPRSRPRPTLLVVENLDAAEPQAFAELAASFDDTTRLVATRGDPARPLPELLARDPSVRVVALEAWGDEEVRAWLRRALGSLGAPWERSGEPLALPRTPAALIEALAAYRRAQVIVRRGAGYVFRASAATASVRGSAFDTGRRPETLDALLACIKAPVPERVCATYLGAWAGELPELLARGVLVGRGDGTMQIADEPRRATLYGRLAPAQRQALHRRLAQALEEVGAPPHRVADEWLESDAPLLAVPHLLAAAEVRPGRSWLPRALSLVERARRLVVSTGEREALELWRYEALVVRTEARVLLACGELAPVEALVTRLGEIGSEAGHRQTLQSALEVRLALDLRLKDWERLVQDAAALLALEGPALSGHHARPGPGSQARPISVALGRLHWARALRFRAEGLPAAALAELDAGLDALGAGVDVLAEAVEIALHLLEARADLCLDVQWQDLAEEATAALLALAERTGRPDGRARARLLEAARWRMEGRLDRALAIAQDNAEALPRERTPALDALVELELGWCRFEVGEFDEALGHASCADTLAREEGSDALVARAAVLEATTAWYLGRSELAWRRAQEAVRAGGQAPDAVAVSARLLMLELALAMRGFAGADAILQEASDTGWYAHRRLEIASAARGFRLAAEAALVRRETVLAVQLAERACEVLERQDRQRVEAGTSDAPAARSHLHLPRYLMTLGRARLAAGAREAAEAATAKARAELMAMAARFADAELRERWLAHPDQRAILGKRPTHSLA